MSSSSSSSSSERRRIAPALYLDGLTTWEMMFQAHVGYAERKLFQKAEPAIDEAKLNTLLDGGVAGGADTRALHSYEKNIKYKLKKWNQNCVKISQSLVESLCDSNQTKLMALEFQSTNTVQLYASLKD